MFLVLFVFTFISSTLCGLGDDMTLGAILLEKGSTTFQIVKRDTIGLFDACTYIPSPGPPGPTPSPQQGSCTKNAQCAINNACVIPKGANTGFCIPSAESYSDFILKSHDITNHKNLQGLAQKLVRFASNVFYIGNPITLPFYELIDYYKLESKGVRPTTAQDWLQWGLWKQGNNYVLAFRGTVSFAEWSYNLNFQSVKCDLTNCPENALLHKGFLQAYRIMKEEKNFGFLPYLNKNMNIEITGHSLGGAMAILASYDLKNSGYKISSMVAFGAPRVGNPQFEASYNQVQGNMESIRITAVDEMYIPDIVSRLPSDSLTEVHRKIFETLLELMPDSMKKLANNLPLGFADPIQKPFYVISNRPADQFFVPIPSGLAKVPNVAAVLNLHFAYFRLLTPAEPTIMQGTPSSKTPMLVRGLNRLTTPKAGYIDCSVGFDTFWTCRCLYTVNQVTKSCKTGQNAGPQANRACPVTFSPDFNDCTVGLQSKTPVPPKKPIPTKKPVTPKKPVPPKKRVPPVPPVKVYITPKKTNICMVHYRNNPDIRIGFGIYCSPAFPPQASFTLDFTLQGTKLFLDNQEVFVENNVVPSVLVTSNTIANSNQFRVNGQVLQVNQNIRWTNLDQNNGWTNLCLSKNIQDDYMNFQLCDATKAVGYTLKIGK